MIDYPFIIEANGNPRDSAILVYTCRALTDVIISSLAREAAGLDRESLE